VPIGRYVVGVLLGAIVLGPILAGAVRVRRRALPRWEGPPARVAEAVLSAGLLLVALELAGIAGALDRVGVVVACLAIGAVAWLLAPRLAQTSLATPRPPASTRTGGAVALGAASIAAAAWLGWVVSSYRAGMESVDTLWYHLPFAARFVQTGSILHLHYVDRDPVTVFYPSNSELFHSLGLVLFRSDVLSPLINLLWGGLALAAAWSIGRPHGRAPHCLLAVVLVLSTPGLVDTQPGGAYDDIVGIALLLAAAALLVNGGLAGPVTAIAAAAAGFAFGTKYQFVIPALALGVGVVGVSAGRRARAALIWTVGLFVLGSYWYLRNTVIVGNPFPPLAHLGPLSLPSPQATTRSFTVGQYLFNGTVWRAFYLPGFRDSLGRAWWALLALMLAGSLGAPALDREPVRRMLGGVVAVGIVAFVVTPQFLGLPGLPIFFVDNVRYLASPLALGLVLVPINRVMRAPPLGNAWLALGAAILLATVIDRRVWSTGFTGPSTPGFERGGGAIAAGAVLGGAILLAPWLAGFIQGLKRRLPFALAGVVSLLACGWLVADSYAHRRFTGTAPLPRIYAWAQLVHHQRIGIVGLVEQYPLYGRDASNYVQFIGRPESHSGIASIGTCHAWRAAVNRGHYGWLVLAPVGFPLDRTIPVAPEAGWTLTSPRARLVIREHALNGVGTAILARITGRLDPAAC
jgi:hypothetical protein